MPIDTKAERIALGEAYNALALVLTLNDHPEARACLAPGAPRYGGNEGPLLDPKAIKQLRKALAAVTAILVADVPPPEPAPRISSCGCAGCSVCDRDPDRWER